MDERVARDRELIVQARQRGRLPLLGAFVKLSGPGWLQSAITLGGGSLAGSLYLGVLAGYSMLWLQPLAMVLGVIMLSAIGYVTLATGQRPFQAINTYVNPVLGWGWAIASMLANFVWLMPQFSLGTAALQQNLLPSTFNDPAVMQPNTAKAILSGALFISAMAIVWFYHSGGRGIKIFETILKLMVGVVVVSFFGVVWKLSGTLPWSEIATGFIPDISTFSTPSPRLMPYLEAIDAERRAYWTNLIVSQQRDVMITAAATAVGINMTFFLPYSMLARGWNREFRGLAIFDLSTGLFIPFMLATTCVVLASASQFHAQPVPGLVRQADAQKEAVEADPRLVGRFNTLIDARLADEQQKRWPNVAAGERTIVEAYALRQRLGDDRFKALSQEEVRARGSQLGDDELAPFAGAALVDAMDAERKALMISPAEQTMAAMLVTRDAIDLAGALEPFAGRTVSHIVFGVGVLGMALSTIIMLSLVNGFVLCEMLNRPGDVFIHRIGAVAAAGVGFTGPFFWGKAAFWLAVPTSVFAMVLLPVAYLTFALLMNQRKLLGRYTPSGLRRVQWNVLMTVALIAAGFGSVWTLWDKAKWFGVGGLIAFIVLLMVTQVLFPRKAMPLADCQEEVEAHAH